MKATVPALTPLLRSNTQGNVLALLVLNPDEEFSLADLARHTGGQPATIHREVERLAAAGILRDRRVGRARLVRADEEHEWYRPLEQLLRTTYGPRVVLEPLVAELPDVREAYIYGSWAARYQGEVGPPPRDIDVLVVGSTPQADLAEVGRIAQRALRREVNVSRVSPADWDAVATPFVKTLKRRPLLPLRNERNPA